MSARDRDADQEKRPTPIPKTPALVRRAARVGGLVALIGVASCGGPTPVPPQAPPPQVPPQDVPPQAPPQDPPPQQPPQAPQPPPPG